MEIDNVSASAKWNILLNILADPTVSEIDINNAHSLWMVHNGVRVRIPKVSFRSDEEYRQETIRGLIPHVVVPEPWSDDTEYLFEGSLQYNIHGRPVRGRCHINLPPVSRTMVITITNRSDSFVSLESMLPNGTMSANMMKFLESAVKARLSIAISGKNGTGKTTMLEALTHFIPENVKIGVAEDIPELVLQQDDVVYSGSFPWRPNMDPNKEATLSYVVRQFFRQRIERAIVGETRGKEFADFLNLANGGMEGSMTTIHADSPRRCLDKMTSFALLGSEHQPISSVNSDIAHSIDLIVQLSKNEDTGAHRIASIEEVSGTVSPGPDAKISSQPLYVYHPEDDTFEKVGQITDALRQKFRNAKVPFKDLLQDPMEKRISAVGGASVPTIQKTRSFS